MRLNGFGMAVVTGTLLSMTACSDEAAVPDATVAGGESTPKAGATGAGSSGSDATGPGASGMAQITPGQYDTRVEMIRFDVPGMPAAAAAQVRAQMASQFQQATSSCLTPEQARTGREGRLEDLTQATNGQCQSESVNDSGGRISGTLICNGGPGGAGAVTISFDGTLASDASDVTLTTSIANPGDPRRPISQVMRVTSRRTGECSGETVSATVSSSPVAPPAPPSSGKPER